MGLRDGLDAVAKREDHCPYWKSNPGLSASNLVTVLTELRFKQVMFKK